MNKRIKELREYWKLSQEDFGKILGITKSGVSDIEAGRRRVTEKHIIMLKNHNVNENWLRTGKGEKVNSETTPELRALANKYNLSNEAQVLIEKFVNLKPEHQGAVIQFIIQVVDSLKENEYASTLDHNNIADAEAAYEKRLGIAPSMASIALNTSADAENTNNITYETYNKKLG